MDPKLRDSIVSDARAWEGQEFRPGFSAQCANFVRHVFAKRGIILNNSRRPSDQHLWPAMPLDASYANSLAGDEIGPVIARNDVQPGDLVFFKDTYASSAFPPGIGLITHVGIATSRTMMVDRSTSAHPIHERSIDGTFPGLFAEARRPFQFVGIPASAKPVEPTQPEPRVLVADGHDGKRSLRISSNGSTQTVDTDAPIDFHFDGKFPEVLRINGRPRKVVAYHLEMKFVDVVDA